MPKGGARTRSGPAPDPLALRRDRDKGEWLLLPAEGRKTKAPDWPLLDPTERELEQWKRLWRRPQAVAWERLGLVDQVALYCRRWCEAEAGGSSVALSTLVRQLEDSLGLSVPGMNSLKWRIVVDETAGRRTARTAKAPARKPSSRDRLKVVAAAGDGA